MEGWGEERKAEKLSTCFQAGFRITSAIFSLRLRGCFLDRDDARASRGKFLDDIDNDNGRRKEQYFPSPLSRTPPSIDIYAFARTDIVCSSSRCTRANALRRFSRPSVSVLFVGCTRHRSWCFHIHTRGCARARRSKYTRIHIHTLTPPVVYTYMYHGERADWVIFWPLPL